MPNYDEYLIAYKDRDLVVDSSRARNMGVRLFDAFSHHLVTDGRLAGSWNRTERPGSVLVNVAPYQRLTPAGRRALISAAERYGTFVNLPVSLFSTGTQIL